MAYTRTEWVNDKTPAINATNLNNIENGIEEAHNSIGNLSNLNTTNKDNLVNAINENVINYVDEEEIVTNELYNGKRIYKKIINFTTPDSVNVTYDISISSLNIDKLLYVSGIVQRLNTKLILLSDTQAITVDDENNTITLYINNTDSFSFTGFITIEYTKK